MGIATKRNIGSTTQLRNEDNTFAGDYEYAPTVPYAGGATTDHQFTGKYHDTKADLYYFPFRWKGQAATGIDVQAQASVKGDADAEPHRRSRNHPIPQAALDRARATIGLRAV